MSTTLATIYAMILHVCGLAAVVVLLALGKIDETLGVSLLSTLLGIGIGAGVSVLTPTPAAAPAAPAGSLGGGTVTAQSPVTTPHLSRAAYSATFGGNGGLAGVTGFNGAGTTTGVQGTTTGGPGTAAARAQSPVTTPHLAGAQ
jgi:hypothetical protein